MIRARLLTWLGRLPTLLGAAFLAFCGVQIGWNAAVGGRWPELRFHLKPPPGYVAGGSVTPSVSTVLDGTWQHDIASRLGVQVMIYRSALQWKHQAYYSLLGMSGVSNIIVGRQRELIERNYVNEFCRRDPLTIRQLSASWAGRLRALQDVVEARGQMFLYVITPSKVAVHPEYLPAGYPCPGAARASEKLTVYLAALHDAGVHVVDGPAVVKAARGRDVFDAFPQGGIHWDAAGAALAAQAVIRALDEKGAHLSPFVFTAASRNDPQGWDRDLSEVLNLVFKLSYPVPVLTYQSEPVVPCRPTHIVEIAGSFIYQLNDALAQTACPPETRTYFYWHNLTQRTSEGWLHKQPENPQQRAADILHWADIVILEENDAGMPESVHGQELMNFIQRYKSSRQPVCATPAGCDLNPG